jgi:hypothetical protein
MGNAFAAVADDASGLFFNPAASTQIKRFTFGGAYRQLSLDRSLQQLAMVFPVRNEAAIGLSAELASMGEIIGRNRIGEPTGELDNLDATVTVTFARRFSELLSFGGNARYYTKKLESITTYSVGFDVGAMMYLTRDENLPEQIPVETLRLAVVVRHITAKYPWNTGDYWQSQGRLGSDVTDEVPLTVVVGTSASLLNSKLLLAADGEKTQHKTVKMNIGAEIAPVRYATLRTGLAQGRPTFGLGLFTEIGDVAMQIDIAVEKAQHVGGWETIVGSTWQL